MPLTVDIQNQTDLDIDQAELEKHLESILQRLGRVGMVSLEITLVRDKAIQELNRRHLQHDYPTDVLSFANEETPTPQHPLGSLVISTDTATRQAQAAGVSITTEINTLAGHGLLHLLGYHHR